MKKLPLFFFFFCLCSFSKANSVTIKLFNNSNSTIIASASDIHNGSFLVKDHGLSVDKTECPSGEVVIFKTGAADIFCGTDGYIEFQVKFENKIYQIHISFDNPFIGSNEFYGSASSPFIIKYLSGGNGSDAVVSYELTGGPTATPPPPPVQLPVTGNRTVSGYLTWDITETGLPKNENLTTAFSITVKAPTALSRTKDGTGNDSYQEYNGYFNEFSVLKNARIQFTDPLTEPTRNEKYKTNILSKKRTVRYSISNLPEGIPLDIKIIPTSNNWNPGSNTVTAPANNAKARWTIFVLEKSRTANGILYDVFGGWLNPDGSYGGNVSAGLKKEFSDALRKNIKSDFLFKQDVLKTNLKIKQQSVTTPQADFRKKVAPAVVKPSSN